MNDDPNHKIYYIADAVNSLTNQTEAIIFTQDNLFIDRHNNQYVEICEHNKTIIFWLINKPTLLSTN